LIEKRYIQNMAQQTKGKEKRNKIVLAIATTRNPL
jgi:hypothetical protein